MSASHSSEQKQSVAATGATLALLGFAFFMSVLADTDESYVSAQDPEEGTVIVDDGQSDFLTSKSWKRKRRSKTPRPYARDYRRRRIASDGTDGRRKTSVGQALWRLDELDDDKTYEVYISWRARKDFATQAKYTIYGATSRTYLVDQTEYPSLEDDKYRWEYLGDFSPLNRTISVHLTNESNGDGKYVVADAAKVVEKQQPSASGLSCDEFSGESGTTVRASWKCTGATNATVKVNIAGDAVQDALGVEETKYEFTYDHGVDDGPGLACSSRGLGALTWKTRWNDPRDGHLYTGFEVEEGPGCYQGFSDWFMWGKYDTGYGSNLHRGQGFRVEVDDKNCFVEIKHISAHSPDPSGGDSDDDDDDDDTWNHHIEGEYVCYNARVIQENNDLGCDGYCGDDDDDDDDNDDDDDDDD